MKFVTAVEVDANDDLAMKIADSLQLTLFRLNSFESDSAYWNFSMGVSHPYKGVNDALMTIIGNVLLSSGITEDEVPCGITPELIRDSMCDGNTMAQAIDWYLKM